MNLAALDWIIILSFFCLTLGINFHYRKASGKSLADFFLSGRKLPWYLAGVSMVATTFAADTPLAVTEIVHQNGIAGNWLWWNALAGGMLTTFFFAHLWRRSGVVTEVELIELRYSGKPAAVLRGFKAIYLGLFLNVMIIGWVNLALMSLLQVFFDMEPATALGWTGLAMVFVALYSSMAGLKGIAVTDFIQFWIAIGSCILLAVLVIQSEEIGGMASLKTQLSSSGALDFFPRIGSGEGLAQAVLTLPVGTFLAYATMQWWASWYPGAEPGGGGYVAQRMLSTPDARQAVWATLLFQVAHYCLRPWPWILVGLAALILYPQLGPDEARLGYVMAMRDFLPSGLKGLLLTAFFAAYMSTISTQLNWGAGYLINDVYNRFLQPTASGRHLVLASRLATLLLMVIGLAVTTQLTSIKAVWEFLFQCGAGLGLVLILRWYWWRINAWSEIAATLAPILAYGWFQLIAAGQDMADQLGWGSTFMIVVGFTTIVWLVVTFVTKPSDEKVLQAFHDRIRPGGWWGRFQTHDSKTTSLGRLALCWLNGLTGTYACLFFIGKVLFGDWLQACMLALLALVSFGSLYRLFPQLDTQLLSTEDS